MAVQWAPLLGLVAMNPLMTFDHTNPFSSINTDARQELRESRVIHIGWDYSRLEAQLMTPMEEIAHERQFVTAQLGLRNDGFENQHTAKIARFLKDRHHILSPLVDQTLGMDYLLSFQSPQGTEHLPASISLPLVIEDSPLLQPQRVLAPPEPQIFERQTNPSFPASLAAMSISFINNSPTKSNDNISVDSQSSEPDSLTPDKSKIRNTRLDNNKTRISRDKRLRERSLEILKVRIPSKYLGEEKKALAPDAGRRERPNPGRNFNASPLPHWRPQANEGGKRRLDIEVDDALGLGMESQMEEGLGFGLTDAWRAQKRMRFDDRRSADYGVVVKREPGG